MTAARGGEYAPTQCFVPGAAAVTVTRTTSSHSSPSSFEAFEVSNGISRRQETENPAALRASRRDVGSGNRIRAGSIAERGWCSSLNPPPDGDGVAGGRLRGRRGRRESRQERSRDARKGARGCAAGRTRGRRSRSSPFGTRDRGGAYEQEREDGQRPRDANERHRRASQWRQRPSSSSLFIHASEKMAGACLVDGKMTRAELEAPPRRRSQSERAR